MTRRVEFDALEGAFSLHRAKLGDLSVFLERLRGDCSLLDEERQLAADLIEGVRKRPPNRPAAFAVEHRNDEIVTRILIETEIGGELKVAERVAHDLGLKPEHVRKIHAQIKDDPRRYRRAEERAARLLESYNRALTSHARERRQRVQKRWNERRERRRLRLSTTVTAP